ncbi:MAG: antitoxin [Sedimentisphaerales bacterium]|nr:antitoxin [Sedimentisphaerales bacterium]
MDTAKIFNNGRSQAVRLPKEYRFDCDEVGINRIGDVVVLYPQNSGWESLLRASGQFTEDFMADRKQPDKADRRPGL